MDTQTKKYSKQSLVMSQAWAMFRSSEKTFKQCLIECWAKVIEVYKKAESKAKYGSKTLAVCLETSLEKINKRTNQTFEDFDFGMM